VLRWVAAALAGGVLFVLGVAVGAVLDDSPDPTRSPTRTLVRTLGPLPLSAPPTVTVTLTAP
jgi:ABC-type molybdate transport system permease subunit